MARYVIAGRSTVVGTTVRGQFSLYSVASREGYVREVGLTNTTTNELCVGFTRFISTGGVGAALTEGKYNDAAADPQLTGFAGHTSDPVTSSVIRQAALGAAVGSGVIWTFGDTGVRIPAGTDKGVGSTIPTGTGQIVDYHVDWDE